MSKDKPRVSIGVPVFNGEKYLAVALDSLLAQTYSDFELIISDNASTDGTQEICRTYAARDCRIRFFRNKINLGAAKNFNRTFELSSGEYFKWAAHDDLCAPEYLERCVEVLDRKLSVLVCHTKTIYIDENGEEYGVYDDQLDLHSLRPYKRYHDYFFRPYKRCNAIFGVIRANELKKTPLIGCYFGSDQVLLGELTLRGEVYRVPEPLFLRRDHLQQPWRRHPTRQSHEAWFDPTRATKITLPHWRLLFEHFMCIKRVPLSWNERKWCYIYLGWWARQHWRYLAKQLILQ